MANAQKRCLVVCVPSDTIPAWQGGVGERRRLAPPGSPFNGKEGRLRDSRTGWYEPVGWLTAEMAERSLTIWDGEVNEGEDESSYRAQTVARFEADGPEDYPGLDEHYPNLPMLCGCGQPANAEQIEGWNPELYTPTCLACLKGEAV